MKILLIFLLLASACFSLTVEERHLERYEKYSDHLQARLDRISESPNAVAKERLDNLNRWIEKYKDNKVLQEKLIKERDLLEKNQGDWVVNEVKFLLNRKDLVSGLTQILTEKIQTGEIK